ncbi:protein Star-like [Macrobrachium nipponense]|uniref:protein Star-like n=1 Tax=Macrobrachium nipponense TaxID=159736 RepID=UPI0030C8AA51
MPKRFNRHFRPKHRILGSLFIGFTLTLYTVITVRDEGFLWCPKCEGCYIDLWTSHLLYDDQEIINYIKEQVLDPPQEHPPNPPRSEDLYNTTWEGIGDWIVVQTIIRSIFALRKNGLFVEVGAGDGVFLSHTSWLEVELGWKGLLIEPRNKPYKELRLRRKAASAMACASDEFFSKKDVFWTPILGDDISSSLYNKISDGKSTLLTYVAPEDHHLGTTTSVQCFSLRALIFAAVENTDTIDFLVIHTMGGEANILETVRDFTVLVLLIRYHTRIDLDDIDGYAKTMDMKLYEGLKAIPNRYIIFVSNKVRFVAETP